MTTAHDPVMLPHMDNDNIKIKAHGGHRYISLPDTHVDEIDGASIVIVMDDSMDTSWRLDRGATIHMGREYSTVPLVHRETGEASTTPATPAEAIMVAATYGMTVYAQGRTYKVVAE